MIRFYLSTFVLLFSWISVQAQFGKDCCFAQPLTGKFPLNIDKNIGNGIREDLSPCSCLATDEHDAHWFSFQCTKSGSFEMMITPIGLGADYDFALYARQCPCNPMTVVTSCDYTGPITPPGPFVPTGIASNPMASFGVPGLTEFQPTVFLIEGVTYYLIADNITDNDVGFDIVFGGDAQIGPPPPNPPAPAVGPITGVVNACPGASVTYSVPNNPEFTNYVWYAVPGTVFVPNYSLNYTIVEWTQPGVYQICVEGKTICEFSPPTCITVNVQPIVTTPIRDTVCLGESYTAPDGQVFWSPGLYNLPLDSWLGCDSTVQLILDLALPSTTVMVKQICQGDCVEFGGDILCESGSYTQVLENQAGCDSTILLSLLVFPSEVIITGADTLSCNKPSIVLDGSGSIGGANLKFQWKNPAGQVIANTPKVTVTTAGTYTLTVTHTVGSDTCVDVGTVTIVGNTNPPNLSASGGTISCTNPSVVLAGNSTTPGATFSWTGPGGFTSNQQNPSVSVTGTYVLTVTGPNSCTATASALVNGDANLPNASANGGTINCANPSVTLVGTSTTPGVTYSWTGPGGFLSDQQNPVVTAQGSYILTVTAPNACSTQATALVVQDTNQPDAAATGGLVDCTNTTLNLQGNSTTPGVTYAWTGPGGFVSSLQNPVAAAPGTYTLTVTAPNHCTATATASVVQNAANPDASAAGGLLNCDNPTLNLQANSTTPGVNYQWSGPGGFSSTAQNPGVNAPGNYVLTVTATNGCTNSATAVVLQDNTPPSVSAGGGILTCAQPSVALAGNSGTPGVTWSWTGPGGFSSDLQNPVVNQAGTYTLTVTAANGCTASASVSVQGGADFPDASAEGGTLDCNTTSVQLNGNTTTAGATISWSGPGGFSSSQLAPLVTVPGSYVLTITSPNNCTAQATAIVFQNTQPPDISATGGVITCTNAAVTLNGNTATPGAAFAWNGPAGFTSTLPDPVVTVAGSYTLTLTGQNGCTSSATALVDEDKTLPDAQATGGLLNCTNDTIQLSGSSATAGAQLSWSGPGGFSSSDPAPMISIPGDYLLTVVGPNGCTATATAVVSQDIQTPDATALGGLLTCAATSVMLNGSSATPGVGWAWQGPGGFISNQQNPVVSQPGNYLLTVIAPNGCTASSAAVVIQNINPPDVSASGALLNCSITTAQITGNSATNGATYAWTGPGGFSSTQQNPTVTQAGIYTLTVMGPNGCTATATATVNADLTQPNASATGGILTCDENFVVLSGNSSTPGVSFTWTGPAGYNSTEQNPTVAQTGTYTLTVMAANGCTATATATVGQDASLPNVSASGGQLNCKVTSLALTGNSTTPGVAYSWTGPGGFTSSLPNPIVTASGTYVLTVTSDNGCSSSASALVTSDTQPPNASASGGVLDCQVTSISLGGSSSTPGVTWSWTGPGGFSSNLQNPPVSAAGIYLLTVTATNGCISTATAEVSLDAAVPSATASGGTLTCLVTQVSLNGNSSQNGVTYSWTGPGGFNSNQQNPVTGLAGTYTLTVTAPNGCSATTTALVGQNTTAPIVVITQPGQLDCVNESVTLNAGGSDAGAGFVFQWISQNGSFVSGQNTLTPTVNAPGVYTLEVLNQTNGCAHQESVLVTLSDEVPSGAALSVLPPVCFGENNGSIEIGSVQGGTAPYLYSLNGQPFSSGNVFGNLAAGAYTLTIQDVTGCEWETTLLLETPPQWMVEVNALDLSAPLLLGKSVELKATVLPQVPGSQFQSIVWTPQGVDATCPACFTLTVTPLVTTEYTLTVTDQHGCTASDALTVVVDRTRPVFVPNAFSPNDDGINDILTVFAGPSAVKVKSFLIFSRWGETVWEYYHFEPNNPAGVGGWDGRYRGKPLDPAVFTWFAEIEFIDGQTEVFEGDAVLLR